MPYPNDSFQQVHVTSNSLMLFSGDMSLRLSLYDQTLSLSFVPAVTDSATGKRKFPKENATNVMLTAERVAALYDIITHRTLYALENKTFRSDSLTCNRDGSMMIGIEITPEQLVNLIVYAQIGEDRIPKKILKFNFQDITPVLNFNPSNGEFSADDHPIHAQLILFLKMLDGFLTAVSGAEHHFGKYNDRFTDRRFMDSIGALATKLGVSTSRAPQYNNSVPGVNVTPGANFPTGNTTSTAGVPVAELTDINQMFGSDVPF